MLSRLRAAPTLRGALDAPAGIVVARGEVDFAGWALAGFGPPASVELVVNGGPPRSAQIRGDRPDVGRAVGEPRAGIGCGWDARLDVSGQPQGELSVQVVAADSAGRRRVVAERRFVLGEDGMVGFFDAPADRDRVDGDLLIAKGWSWAPAGVATVEIHFDGQPLGRARLGLARPDVHAHNPSRFGGATGWEFRGAVPQGMDGKLHQVSATATDTRGVKNRLGSARVQFAARSATADQISRADRLRERTATALKKMPWVRPEGRSLLTFTHSLGLGGGQLYLQDLLRGLVSNLDGCRVVAPTPGILARELEEIGADVVIAGGGLPADLDSYEGAVFQLATFIRASGCSVVLLNTIGQWVAADAAQRAGVPTLWAIHESFELSDWLNLNYGRSAPDPYIRARLDAALQAATRLIFEANATRDLFVRAGVPRHRTKVVPYGIDVDAIEEFAGTFDRAAARKQHGLRAGSLVLLCVGIYEERKGQAWLAEAFSRLAQAHPEATLVLVGDHPNPYSDVVHEAIDRHELGGRVLTIPITPDIWDWYAMSDVLVSCSDVESLPRSMLEAMAFGVGVLSSDAWGVPELITEGETGWLTRSKDLGALIAGLHRVLAIGADEREAVSRAGRDLVRTHYRAGGYVGEYLRLIDELTTT
jgi:D-inositol-3-phosphate glycosyltransferase